MSNLRKVVIDGKEIEVDGAMTLIQACEVAGIEVPRFCYHERLTHRGQLPDVSGRGRGRPAEACGLLRDAGARSAPRPGRPAAGGQDQLADGQEGPRGGDGVPADQPSAGLPDLRPGRRMRPAGSGDGLRRRFRALPRTQARDRGPRSGAAGRNPDDALHLLHPLRALHHRSGGHPPDGPDRARRGCGDHLLSRPDAGQQPAGQHHRSLPGRAR